MQILKDEGYKMRYATSGLKALELAQKDEIDLILLDIMMPGMDGFQTCKKLKEDPKTAAIPILFLSGKDSYEDIKKAYECGGSDYIVKPFIDLELKKKVAIHSELVTLKREVSNAKR